MVTMDGDGMFLVGSNPPTYRGSSPLPQNPAPVESPTNYSGRISDYFEQNGRRTVNSPARKTQSKIRSKSLPRYNSSYVDETLFGVNRPGSQMLGGGDVDLELEGSRPASQQSFYRSGSFTDRRPESRTRSRTQSRADMKRPQSARTPTPSSKNTKSKLKFKDSYVDEMLFGPKVTEPGFEAPWGDKSKTKLYTFDCTDYKAKSKTQEANSGNKNQFRPKSATKVTKPQTPMKARHNAPFVDESLFGPKVSEPGWKAPWDEPEKKRINIYDAFQHKLVIKHDDVKVVKPKPMIPMQRPTSVSTGKPIWR